MRYAIFGLWALLCLVSASSIAAEGGGNDTQYLKLHPAFVVNLAGAGSAHYLQAEVQVMSHGTKGIEAVKRHMPAIRHQLLMLFSDQTADQLRSTEGKQALLASALSAIQAVLKENTGRSGIDGVYFSSFVIQ